MKFQIQVVQTNLPAEKTQLKSISNSIKAALVEQRHQVEVVDYLKEQASNQVDNTILLVSGKKGLALADELKKHGSDALVVWAGHCVVDEFKTIKRYPDICVLPEGVAGSFNKEKLSRKTNLVETEGFAHQVTSEAVKRAQLVMKSSVNNQFFELAKEEGREVLAISLGGDFKDEQGELHLFSPEEAQDLAHNIFSYLEENQFSKRKLQLFLVNSSNTGIYNSKTRELLEQNPHQSANSFCIDDVTKKFFSQLSSLIHQADNNYDINWCCLNYKNQEPSAYLPILEAVTAAKGTYFIPASQPFAMIESTYAASEGTDVIAYKTQSLSPESSSYLISAYKSGVLGVLELDGKHQPRLDKNIANARKTNEKISDAVQVALGVGVKLREAYPLIVREEAATSAPWYSAYLPSSDTSVLKVASVLAALGVGLFATQSYFSQEPQPSNELPSAPKK